MNSQIDNSQRHSIRLLIAEVGQNIVDRISDFGRIQLVNQFVISAKREITSDQCVTTLVTRKYG